MSFGPILAVESRFCSSVPPSGKRVPFGWKAIPIGAESLVLRFPNDAPEFDRVRFTVALDEREEKRVRLALAESGALIEEQNLRFPYSLQMIEFRIPSEVRAAVLRGGISLAVEEGKSPLWIFGDEAPRESGHEFLLPHLMPVAGWGDVWEESLRRLCSAASLQPFGWIEGCVLEGLDRVATSRSDLKAVAKTALRQHFDHFFTDIRIIAETPLSHPGDDDWHGTEGGIMVAIASRLRSTHPALDKIHAKWNAALESGDPYIGSATVTCEGCLTVAYPMAVLARVRNDAVLSQFAAQQLAVRDLLLFQDGWMSLRTNHQTGVRSYRNWARGIAWFIWGHALTIRELRASGIATTKIDAVLRERIRWILGLQQTDGLWSCFAGDAETGAETSGSAGIASGIITAHSLGIVGNEVLPALERCHTALERYLTPDGFLGGVTQSNKGVAGEALQRSGYRILSQMGQAMACYLHVSLAALR